jgi:hypothetical protein
LDTLEPAFLNQHDAITLQESARPISVVEGGKNIKLTAYRTLIRSMYRTAAQGDGRVQRILLQEVNRVESARAARDQVILGMALKHLETWSDIFYQHERDGLPPPDVYPHPADIEIDMSTGKVTYHGPATKEQAGAVKALEDRALASMLRFWEVVEALKTDPKNRELRSEYKQLKMYAEVFRQKGEKNIRRMAWKEAQDALRNVPKNAPKQQKRAKRKPVTND